MNHTDYNSPPPEDPREPYDWKPWIWIGLAWVFVWPLGLYFTVDKLRKDRRAREAAQRVKMFWETDEAGQQPHYQQSYQKAQRYHSQYEYHYSSSREAQTSKPVRRQRAAQRGSRSDARSASASAAASSQTQRTAEQSRLQKLRAKLSSPRAGRRLMAAGGIIAAFWGLLAGNEFLSYLFLGPLDAFEEAYPLLMLAAVGVALLIWGGQKVKRARKFRSYFAKTGPKPAVPIQELCQLSGDSFNKTVDDLQYLLDKGAFGPNAYLDLGRGTLILDPVGAAQAEEAAKRAAAKAQTAQAQDPSAEILREIRRINNDISDERLSQQIDRIEEITRLILQCQKEHPEKAPQLHSFLSYYLPTTLKILSSYAELEKQSVQGRNITGTKQRIEGMMDKVVRGFETQLDQLFAADYMDISADITVLEQMLQKDGLAGDFQTEENLGRSASAK